MGKKSEEFHEALKAQYRDLVYSVLLESESNYRTSLNLGILNMKLKEIVTSALQEGLSEFEIHQIIENVTESEEHHYKKAA